MFLCSSISIWHEEKYGVRKTIRCIHYPDSYPYENDCPSNKRFRIAYDMFLLCIGSLDQRVELSTYNIGNTGYI